jgi:predicted nuclease of predicted toxin-antitoxin system
MRFLLDENVSHRVASHLKAAGHDAVHVSDIGLTSAEDLVVLVRARDEDRFWFRVITISCRCSSPPGIPGRR